MCLLSPWPPKQYYLLLIPHPESILHLTVCHHKSVSRFACLLFCLTPTVYSLIMRSGFAEVLSTAIYTRPKADDRLFSV